MNHPLTACISEIELLHERIAEKNARIEALEAALLLEWAARDNRIEALEKARDRAERALGHAGWSYTEGAEEWKPPLGPSAAPSLDRIEALEAALREIAGQMLVDEHDEDYNGDYEAGYDAIVRIARTALAEGQDT